MKDNALEGFNGKKVKPSELSMSQYFFVFCRNVLPQIEENLEL
eukprot:CAMPEP_0202975428 /NCGR_PEP_ID=MMETSP1396-20130829/68938_1 /ASSEMBLY_ACC=CAM_ASM_000872 /TAXON_ID= /ORGANISM="Pseudokeronopsis sp., Strain Brazil" /LENGTH=42 /DNA_ID= /DNA_START= /DNA_END= /DNA_ORIENTATION=